MEMTSHFLKTCENKECGEEYLKCQAKCPDCGVQNSNQLCGKCFRTDKMIPLKDNNMCPECGFKEVDPEIYCTDCSQKKDSQGVKFVNNVCPECGYKKLQVVCDTIGVDKDGNTIYGMEKKEENMDTVETQNCPKCFVGYLFFPKDVNDMKICSQCNYQEKVQSKEDTCSKFWKETCLYKMVHETCPNCPNDIPMWYGDTGIKRCLECNHTEKDWCYCFTCATTKSLLSPIKKGGKCDLCTASNENNKKQKTSPSKCPVCDSPLMFSDSGVFCTAYRNGGGCNFLVKLAQQCVLCDVYNSFEDVKSKVLGGKCHCKTLGCIFKFDTCDMCTWRRLDLDGKCTGCHRTPGDKPIMFCEVKRPSDKQ